jgi:23S rRNA pseudouridine2605 synthase
MEKERLHKVLAHAGFGSRRSCEKRIAAGEVEVDGKIVTEMGVKVDPSSQRIKCGGKYVKAPPLVYLLLNKPKNVVTTLKDDRGRRTVIDLLRGIRARVVPAGRLDADSQGMLVLTNDGDLIQKLTHPSFQVSRTYHVVVQGTLDPAVIEKLSKGVWLAEGRTGPVEVHVKKADREVTIVEVVLHEGMNREVRRVFAKFGLKVTHLKRIRIGRLELGNLGDGKVRNLTRNDIELMLADAAVSKSKPRKESEAKPSKPALKRSEAHASGPARPVKREQDEEPRPGSEEE